MFNVAQILGIRAPAPLSRLLKSIYDTESNAHSSIPLSLTLNDSYTNTLVNPRGNY